MIIQAGASGLAGTASSAGYSKWGDGHGDLSEAPGKIGAGLRDRSAPPPQAKLGNGRLEGHVK